MAPLADSPPPAKALEEFLEGIGAEVSREAIAALRTAVLQDVEAKVAEKSEDILRRGQVLLEKLQKKHSDEIGKLSADALQMQQRLQALEAENKLLRTSVADVGDRLSALGKAFGAARGPATESAWASPVVPRDFSERPLPELPPFPMQPGPGAGAISLVEALDVSSAPPRQVVKLSDSITPPPTPAAPSRQVFSFTLRKADGMSLGLNVSHSDVASGLSVEGVRPDGAVEAWNKICGSTGTTSDRGVREGDKILAVNGIRDDPAQMLAECRDAQTVKLTVVRGEPKARKEPTEPSAEDNAKTATALRADASVFVPMVLPVDAANADASKAPASPAATSTTSPREEPVAPEATPEAEQTAA